MGDIVDLLIDAGTVARGLNVSAETVRNWIRLGKLPAIETPTGRYRIRMSDYHTLLTKRRAAAAAKHIQNAQNAQDAQTRRRAGRRKA